MSADQNKPGSERWHAKALEMAKQLCEAEYKRTNPGGYKDAQKRLKRGLPAYVPPRLANELIAATKLHDRAAAEVRVKELMEAIRSGQGELG